MLLYRGLDAQTAGEQVLRKRMVLAPQFHENHVFMGTFLYNLLLGRSWPARAEDVADAERICRQLGLSPLMERMPGGLQQLVGETGWQLSHGERSRCYLARALLQGGELVILDESLASLDPLTLQQTLRCVSENAESVMLIAHP